MKKAMTGIQLIVSAVIGLIIIVVVIMMITGKLGAFGEGTEQAGTCDNLCKGIGKSEHDISSGATATLGLKASDGTQCNCK
jgi:hypothetical protein